MAHTHTHTMCAPCIKSFIPQTCHQKHRTRHASRLRDDARKDKAVLSHLEAENAHTKAVLADTEPLQVGSEALCTSSFVGAETLRVACGSDVEVPCDPL
jgi:hypothetical protein